MAVTYSRLGKTGRLGNMLFEIAATVALAIRNNDQYLFPPWEYENDFNLHGCFSTTINVTNVFREAAFTYQPITYEPNLDLVGFFQSERYFKDVKNIIIPLLTPKNGFGIKWGYTSIHVRRGDYTRLTAEYEQLDMDYYKAAMEIARTEKYLVLSDDIEWCKSKFKGDQFIFSEGNSPVTDLSYAIACENSIISNSSFSWWGAYLNKNPSKIVVAPQKWFGKALPHDTTDLLPKEWIKIDV